jgi:hypothetical protein
MKYILAFALGLMSVAASAKTVTYTFSGVFDAPSRNVFADPSNTEPIFLDLIKAGDHFSGQFTYDSSAPVQSSFDASWGTARSYQLKSFQLQGSNGFNNALSAWPEPTLNTQHTPYGDGYSLVGGSNADGGKSHTVIAVLQGGVDQNAFADAQLPGSLGSGGNGSLSITMYHYDAHIYDMARGNVQIQLAAVSPVPEPSSAAMMLAALAGIGGLAAVRRRQAGQR